ncbi:FtsX-like permease family protein [Isoptericola aurantiacus]|uniref:FtsX-like permease family protein n=1 Tax=Isoptericola aurantiacus TaxID=3377839 RepID=UPI00383BCD4E
MRRLFVVAAAMLRETLVSVRAQRVVSLVTLLVVLGATTTVLVTAGRTAGAQDQVIARLDTVATRTLTAAVSGDDASGLTADVVPRLEGYDAVESAVGLGPAVDVRAAANPAGNLVALRAVYGLQANHAGPSVAGLEQVVVTDSSATGLGISGRGVVREPMTGVDYLVVGEQELPEALRSYDPLVIRTVDVSSAPHARLASLVVVARTPDDVAVVKDLLTQELREVPAPNLMIQASEDLARAAGVVDGELTAQSRTMVLGALAAAVSVVTLVVWGAALIRRRDFGRRRALGATRRMIVTLVVAQVAVLSVVGAGLGAAAGTVWLWQAGHPLPGGVYAASVTMVLATTPVIVSAVPAWWAACRDPLSELRVP